MRSYRTKFLLLILIQSLQQTGNVGRIQVLRQLSRFKQPISAQIFVHKMRGYRFGLWSCSVHGVGLLEAEPFHKEESGSFRWTTLPLFPRALMGLSFRKS